MEQKQVAERNREKEAEREEEKAEKSYSCVCTCVWLGTEGTQESMCDPLSALQLNQCR